MLSINLKAKKKNMNWYSEHLTLMKFYSLIIILRKFFKNSNETRHKIHNMDWDYNFGNIFSKPKTLLKRNNAIYPLIVINKLYFNFV